MTTEKIGYDMGYGPVGNSATKYLIDHILTHEQEKAYRKKLKEQDKDKYDEYLQYEEAIREYQKRQE